MGFSHKQVFLCHHILTRYPFKVINDGMKLVVQRVLSAQVKVEDRVVGRIGYGYLVYAAIHKNDTSKEVNELAKKLLLLRIMPDKRRKMNLSLSDVKGDILIISQFTLYADTSSRRPGFTQAAQPPKAKQLYEYFVQTLKSSGLKVETGEFGAYMQVESINDGPVTIILESTNTGC